MEVYVAFVLTIPIGRDTRHVEAHGPGVQTVDVLPFGDEGGI